MRWLATRVHYPQDGLSHFRLFHDNALISAMHTKLFFGMLIRFPGHSLEALAGMSDAQQHWAEHKERGNFFG